MPTVESKPRLRSAICIPDAVACDCRCRECGSWYVRGPTAWLCEFGHGGLIGDDLMAERLGVALRHAGLRLTAGGLMKRMRRLQRLSSRKGG